MEDRELLELAAKAAGIKADFVGGPEGMWSEELDDYWNPLEDDGDALRLAVKLNLLVDVQIACIDVLYTAQDGVMRIQEGTDEPNPYAATRRAIVRAAAEIGKSLTTNN